MGSDGHPEVDELFAAGPEEFIARRQALVKQLKAAGDRDGAAEVAALRRPTVAAWAVNQLARRHPDELGRLLALGQDLEEAHEGLLSGGRPDSAVTAGRRRREAVAALTDTAMGLLTESGRAADAHRDAIAGTLDAASLDPRSGAVVQAGRLTRELDPPSGFGLDWVADDWSPPPRRTPRRSRTSRTTPPPRSRPARRRPRPAAPPRPPPPKLRPLKRRRRRPGRVGGVRGGGGGRAAGAGAGRGQGRGPRCPAGSAGAAARARKATTQATAAGGQSK